MRSDVIEVMSQVLRVDATVIADDSSPDTIGSWDSLAHLELISALEQKFSIRFNMREIQSMDMTSKIMTALQAHGINA